MKERALAAILRRLFIISYQRGFIAVDGNSVEGKYDMCRPFATPHSGFHKLHCTIKTTNDILSARHQHSFHSIPFDILWTKEHLSTILMTSHNQAESHMSAKLHTRLDHDIRSAAHGVFSVSVAYILIFFAIEMPITCLVISRLGLSYGMLYKIRSLR